MTTIVPHSHRLYSRSFLRTGVEAELADSAFYRLFFSSAYRKYVTSNAMIMNDKVEGRYYVLS